MTTLILPSRHTDDTQALWRAAIQKGWGVERIQGLNVDPTWAGQDPVLYVDGLTADAVKEPLGVDLVEPPLDFLSKLPGQYVGRPVRLTSLLEARMLTEPAFVKPAGDKSFKAAVYASGADLPEDFDDDLPVLVSHPVNFYVEYRFFVLDREPVAGSPYMFEGELIEPGTACPFRYGDADSWEFIKKLCADPAVELPPAVVIDVGLIRYSWWAVVEANPAWGSGILACDPDIVLDVLRRATTPVSSLKSA